MSNTSAPLPLAYFVRDAAAVTSLSKPRIYQLIAEGKIEARKLGRRMVVLADSLRRLVEEGC